MKFTEVKDRMLAGIAVHEHQKVSCKELSFIYFGKYLFFIFVGIFVCNSRALIRVITVCLC